MITDERKLELFEKLALNHVMTKQEVEVVEQLTGTADFKEEYEEYKMLFKGLDGLAAESLIADMKKWDAEAPKLVVGQPGKARMIHFLPNVRLWYAAASIFLVFGLSYSLYQFFPRQDKFLSSLEATSLYSVTRGEVLEDESQSFIALEYGKGNYELIMQEFGALSVADWQEKDPRQQLIFTFSCLKTGQQLEKAERLLLVFPEGTPRLQQLRDFQLFLISFQLGKVEEMNEFGKKILQNPRHEQYDKVQEFYEKKGMDLPQ